jgi:hypothetical protein
MKIRGIAVLTVVSAFFWACILSCGTETAPEDDAGTTKPDKKKPEDVVADGLTGDGGAEVLDAVEAEAVAPEAKLVIDEVVLAGPVEPPCPCGGEAAGKPCAITGTTLEVKVKAHVEPPEAGKIEKVRLIYNKGNSTVEVAKSLSVPNDDEGYYVLKFDLADSEEKMLPAEAEALPDGPYTLTVSVRGQIEGGLAEQTRDLVLSVDRTPPKLYLFKTKTALQEGGTFTGGKFLKEVALKAIMSDEASGPGTFTFQLGEKVLDLGAAPGQASVDVVMDIEQADTDFSTLKVVATDCLGNATVEEHPITIIGLPYYDLPPQLEAADGTVGQTATMPAFTKLKRILVAHVNEHEDPFLDLVGVADEGLAAALNDPGKPGEFHPFVRLFPQVEPAVSITDVIVTNVNRDYNGFDPDTLEPAKKYPINDLVILSNEGGMPHIRIYLRHKLLKSSSPDDGEPAYFQALATFPKEPSEVLAIPGALSMSMLRMADINGDGFEDLVVVGPDDVLTGALYLHTGKVDKPLESDETLEPGEPETYFVGPTDVIQGISSTTDVVVGNFNGDATPDLAFSRCDLNVITVQAMLPNGTFAGPTDTIYCWGGVTHMVAADLGDGKEDDADDLVVATGFNTLHYLPGCGDGNGYFNLHAVPEAKPGYELCGLLEFDDPDFEFGQVAIPNIVKPGLTDAVFAEKGAALTTGGAVDSMLLDFLIGAPGAGGNDSILDLAAAVPEMNTIALFRGAGNGEFAEAFFLNPGTAPRSLVAGNLGGDSKTDLACLVDTDEGTAVAVLLNTSAKAARFPGPWEIPMPVSSDWKAGRVKPTHLVAADFQGKGVTSLVVATEPQPQKWTHPAFQGKAADKEDPEFPAEDIEGSVPLILAYLFDDGVPSKGGVPEVRPYKSTVDVDFGQQLSGLAAGRFNPDQKIDLAVSISRSSSGMCEGRNLDILLGGYQVKSLVNPAALGWENNGLQHYYSKGPDQVGYFTPLGGYAGLNMPNGLVADYLDTDEISDLVLFAPEDGDPAGDDYQPDRVATYLTTFDSAWNSCALADGDKKPWFSCAPPFAIGMQALEACGWTKPEPEEPPPEEPPPEEPPPEESKPNPCQPTVTESCPLTGQRALPSDATGQWETGLEPVAAVTGKFEPGDNACTDIFVANKVTSNVTYLRGICSKSQYKFHSDATKPLLFAIGKEPVAIRVGRLDGPDDPEIDIVAALASNISIAYGVPGNEELPFDNPTYLLGAGAQVQVAPTSLAVADVNNDQYPDLLVTESNKDQIFVFLNGGDRQFFGPYTLPCGKDPVAIVVTELDGDECEDVAVLNGGSRSITILHNRRCE